MTYGLTLLAHHADLPREYFPNKSFEGNPAAVRCDSVISFDWGGGSPDASIPVDGFSVRWTGWVAPADSKRNLKLSVGGDDGYRIRQWKSGCR